MGKSRHGLAAKLICTESEGCCVCTFARQVCWMFSMLKLFPKGAPQLANSDPLYGREGRQFVAQLLLQVEFLVNDLLNDLFTAKCWRGMWAPPQELRCKGFETLR